MDILNKIPDWAVGISVIVLALGVVLLMRRYGVVFKSKNIEFKAGNEPSALSQIIKNTIEICEINFRKRLCEQMSYTKNIIDTIRDMTLKSYYKLLENKGIKDVFEHIAYKSYDKVLYVVLDDMKDICESRFQEMVDIFNKKENENSDYEYIRADFEQYKAHVVNGMLQEASSIITKEWIPVDLITRDEAYKYQLPVTQEIGKLIDKVYQNAIEVQLKYARIAKRLDCEIKQLTTTLK